MRQKTASLLPNLMIVMWAVVLTLALILLHGVREYAAGEPGRYVDVHIHLTGQFGPPHRPPQMDFGGAAKVALASMDELGINKALIMPQPFPANFPRSYDYKILLTDVVRKHPGRFGFLGGGGTLNPMIQQAVKSGTVTSSMRREFEKKAEEIMRDGAVGFGEMTAEHLSMNPNHPYVTAPPDHPLFLLLADIAARHDVPIDIHMEAVPKAMPSPKWIRSTLNPELLQPNIAGFERLLAHSRKAKIVWDHLGWDNTGQRTAALTRELLERNPNLYLSIRIPPHHREARLIGPNGKVEAEWLDVIRAFPRRFVIGSDEFYLSPRMRSSRHPSTGSTKATAAFLSSLPPDLALLVGRENARRLFNLDD